MESGTIFTSLIVGAIAGLLAEFLLGDLSTGWIGTAFLGMVGAVVGSWIFDTLQIATGLRGLLNDILKASAGAAIVLVAVKAIWRG